MIEWLRAVVAGCGGLLFGAALIEAYLYWGRWRASKEERLRWILCVRIGTALLILFSEIELATRLTVDYVTWRLPLSLLAYAVLAVGLTGILLDDERQQGR